MQINLTMKGMARWPRGALILAVGLLASTQVRAEDDIDVEAQLSPAQVREAFIAKATGLAAGPPGQPFVLKVGGDAFHGLFGADISHHVTDRASSSEPRCTIDWNKAAAQGIQFVYMKAAEGTGAIVKDDASFPIHWKELEKPHSEGTIYRGAYHWLSSRPNQSGADQAKHFLSVVSMKGAQLPPAVDFEEDPVARTAEYKTQYPDRCTNTKITLQSGETGFVCDGWTEVSQDERMRRLRDWLDAVSKASQLNPIIYTRTNYWRDMLGPDRKDLMALYSAWIAQYPDPPVAWHEAHKTLPWAMPNAPEGSTYPPASQGGAYTSRTTWQFTEAGKYADQIIFCDGKPKLTGGTDMNWYPSTLADFRKAFQK